MRKDFEMTEEQLAAIIEACKPVPLIALQCGTPSTPQERANAAWRKLGIELGFVWDTARPNGGGDRFFSAVVMES